MTSQSSDKKDDLTIIRECLERIDRRDRMRTIASTISICISWIPIVVLLGGSWYITTHLPEILESITTSVAKSVTESTTKTGSSFLETLKNIPSKMSGSNRSPSGQK